jgi:hypothetical protein
VAEISLILDLETSLVGDINFSLVGFGSFDGLLGSLEAA